MAAIAIVNTGTFTFHAVGDTPRQARAIIKAAWRTHVEQNPAAQMDALVDDEIQVLDGSVGGVFRDGSPFRIQPAGHGDHPADEHTRKTSDPSQPQDGDGNMLCRYCDWPIFRCTITDSYFHLNPTVRSCRVAGSPVF